MRADLGLLYCAAIWGSTFYLVKGALDAVDPVAMVAYRFLLAAACLLPWVLRKKRVWGPIKEAPAIRRGFSGVKEKSLIKEAAILSALLFILYVTQTVGLGYTSASNSGFITGLFVLFVPIFLLLFFGRPPTRLQWAAAALAVAGLWVLTGGVSSVNRGDALTVLAAMTYAGHLLATDTFVRADADATLLAFHQFWMTGLLALVLAWGSGRPLAVRSGSAAGVIAFLTLLPTLSAFYIQMQAQKVASPLKVSLIFSLEPLFAWTLGGETFVPARAAGGLLIVAAMIIGELSKLDLLKGRRKEVLPV